jgi:hypothetical protein
MKDQKVQIKFPIFTSDAELDTIESSLDCRIFVPDDTLEKFLFQLRKIDNSLSSKNSKSLYQTIAKKKELVEKLSIRCASLKERNQVIDFAEKAEELANQSPFLTDEEIRARAEDLRASIDGYVESFRPSTNNMKFLRFARKLLLKAEKHEPVIISSPSKERTIQLRENTPGEISIEAFTLAESLYELAGELFKGNIEIFQAMLEKNFSPSEKKELHFHLGNCKSNLSTFQTENERLKMIQGMIGFANIVTDYYSSDTPYPTIEEVKATFSDPIF